MALSDTQTRFYALDLKSMGKTFSIDDSFNLLKLSIRDAEKDNSLRGMVSTFDPYDQIIRDGYYEGGRKVVTFANILQHGVFPLAELLKMMLEFGSQEMGRPVEIEFAANLPNQEHKQGMLYWLQIRPIVDTKEMRDDEIGEVRDEDLLLKTDSALGHGIMDNIPVKWPHISNSKLIVETALAGYHIEPSQGTHFFQNLTSFGVGYFTINPSSKGCLFDEEYLNRLNAEQETDFLRVVRFERPVIVKINGKKSIGIVIKPDAGNVKEK